MNWYSPALMLLEVFLVSVSFQYTLGFDLFDGENHQALLPLAHTDSSGYLSLVEDPVPSSSVLSYVTSGRRLMKLPQTLIPYPRTGRMTDEDYDIAFLSDYPCCIPEAEVSKLRERILSPHLIRKKRSISDDSENHDEEKSEKRQELSRAILDQMESFDPDFYFRQIRRPSSRSRNSFVPRVGKRLPADELYDIEDKRAAKFTPRIGRASLIPRIGRNDQRFKVMGRGSFIPRIGRRASLTPRIGRAQEIAGESDNN